MLTWIYSNNKLFFTLRCKTTGWCAVAFTTGDGTGMKDYDIALGGVASNGNYLDDYWSTSTTKPTKDSANNFVLTTATEAGGYTTVQFERDPETSDTDNDVQFKPGTEVMIAWAMHSSMDGKDDISRHTDRELLPTKYILVPAKIAFSSGITPTTSTMMVPSSSIGLTPQSTDPNDNDSVTSDPSKISNVLNDHFASVGPKLANKLQTFSSATTVSFGDKFMLTWIYSNNKLSFTLRCKTTGWCAVAFTTGDGSGMQDYDIALGGVASGDNYLDDYWSTSTKKPSKDSANDFVIRTATEAGGYTTVEFERDPETSDTDNDVQFKPGTEVMIAWAMHSSMDGNEDISKHTDREVLPTKYILVPGAANMLESRAMLSAILAAIVVCLVS
ncbi:unnamed protein product [Porites lobata]|uniref:DOMON domain-containing protein n=1 Tax=Porites lobata TaxID=104759 RepID=A0ABN8NP63_9CNID|nr:unnamed protein product [Porites lobata]